MSSLYEVLGIPANADGDQIKAAYRRLARSCHPDVVSASRKETSAGDLFIKIHAAYSTLSDPTKRADYDRQIRRQCFVRRSSSSSSAFSHFPAANNYGYGTSTTSNWETDQCW